MKFKIFADLDCPDWLLAEVFAMSKLSVVKLRLVCSALMKSLASGQPKSDLMATVAKHTADAKFTERDNEALVAALSHLFTSAGKHSVPAETLGEELQQLGLPKEHAGQIVRVFGDSGQVLADYADSRELRLSRLEGCDWSLRLMMRGPRPADRQAQVRFRLAVSLPDSAGCLGGEESCRRTLEFEASEQRLRLMKLETARLLGLMDQIMRSG